MNSNTWAILGSSLLALILLLQISFNEALTFPLKDEASQAELDRLITQAINRDDKEQPSKQEYERYYKVRQFLMHRIHKSTNDEPLTTTTTAHPPPSTTLRFFNKSWWLNRHKTLNDEQPFLAPQRREFRAFPQLKHAHAWRDEAED